jgi:cation diffusion facilitator family transporter
MPIHFDSARLSGMSSPPDTGVNHWAAKRKVTLVGLVANLVLSIGKIWAGIVGQSQALVADGMHSVSDLASDALVLIAARWGSLSADHNHPYGHARIETAATAIIGFLLIAVAVGFALDSVFRLSDPDRLLIPGWLALGAAVLSVLINEGLFQYTIRVGRDTGSGLIQANAWHHRSDALSSIVVIAGVIGAMIGLVWLDAVAAIIVAIMVGWMGWQFIASSVAELVDTGLGQDRLDELDELITSVNGVKGYRRLRTRQMGGQAFMDVQILLDADLSLAEADFIAVKVQRLLIEKVPEMSDVVVGIRPLTRH